MTTLADVRAFLDCRRFAMIGVSHNPQDFSRTLFREFRQRGYDVVPVNPGVSEVDGVACAPRLQDVQPPVDAALLMTSPSVTAQVVEECAQAGIARVWMYRAGGAGAVSPAALSFCQSKGIRTVAGECPMMFLPDAAWPHRVHGFCRRLFGKYPSA
jgi:predicted CoA-binding protein